MENVPSTTTMDALGYWPSPYLNTDNSLNPMVNGRLKNSQLTPNELFSSDRKLASKSNDMSDWAAILSGKLVI